MNESDKVWVIDVSEFAIDEGKLYLSYKGFEYRRDISYTTSSSSMGEMVITMHRKAIAKHPEFDSLIIHHSDQGCPVLALRIRGVPKS